MSEQSKKTLDSLKEELESKEKIENIAIVMHSNPDPDCIGASLGIGKILALLVPDAQCSYWYTGEISHPQNKTMANVLSLQLTDVAEIENVNEAADIYICVDTLPERCLGKAEGADKIKWTLAVDHHRSETKKAKIVDIRPVGATSSIVWEYLQELGIELDKNDEDDITIATALLLGIKTDTSDFVSENVADIDFEAYKHLMEYVSRRHLSAIINYPIPPYLFELRSKLDQDENIKMDNGVFVGGIGYISAAKRDALPSLSEERARVEGIETSFVFAIVGDHIEVSVRSVGLSVDVNALCQKIFGKEFAGGKMGAGAAKIPLGFLSLNGSDEGVRHKMWEAVKELLIHKIFHVMEGNA